jgi:hypothetical protein
MLRKVRTADLRRVAQVRLQVRRMYPQENQAFGAKRTSGTNRWMQWRDARAFRMKPGMRRLLQLAGRVARDGLAQFLRVPVSERSHDRK